MVSRITKYIIVNVQFQKAMKKLAREVFDVTCVPFSFGSSMLWERCERCSCAKGVGKYDKSVEILKMLAAPPLGGKI